jgi:ribonucleoside-diphosphate reductase beta chain
MFHKNKMVVLYTKKNCALCEEAKVFIKTHNIQVTDIVSVNNLYDIVKIHPECEDNDITSFPIFFDDKQRTLLSYNLFKHTYGEILLNKNENRHVIFPIKYSVVWNMYEKAVASFWTVNEIDFSRDDDDYNNVLNVNERYFINNILAFFASADGIVNENLATNFSDEVQLPEARAFYSYQQYNETIHSHTYSLMIDRYVKDIVEKDRLFDGIHTIPSIAKKAKWATRWISKKECPTFAKRLIGFACVEAIMFSGSFCAIFWLKKRGIMPGLSFSNELISRDEGMHQDFAVLLYDMLKNRLREDEVHLIIKEAVEHEKEFITESIPCRLVGMNNELMIQYIEYVADRLCLQLKYNVIYQASNPFDFMETISLKGKTNFFERRVGEYAKAGMLVDPDKQCFAIDEDF